MKKLIIGLILVIFVGFIGWYFLVKDNKIEQRVVPMTLLNQGPFKYFQINALAESGSNIDGEVILNGEKIFDLNKRSGKFVSEKAQDLIKDGQNSIELNIVSASSKDENEAKLTYALEINLHALNAPGVANKSNEVMRILWNPQNTSTNVSGPENIRYDFVIKKDKSKPPVEKIDPNIVTSSEKSIFVNTLAKRRELFSSKDAKAIKAFYVKILPASTNVSKLNDTQILTMAERDLGRLQVPDAVIESSGQWSKDIDDNYITIENLTQFNGEERLFTIKIIDGVWY